MAEQPTESASGTKPQKTAKRTSGLAKISFWSGLGGIAYIIIFFLLATIAIKILLFLFWYDLRYLVDPIIVGLVIIPFLMVELFALICGIAAFFQITFSRSHLKGYAYCVTGIFIQLLLFLTIKAVPNYLRYQAREKQSPAKQNLYAIYTAYQAYHSDYGTYPSAPLIQIGATEYNCISISKWDPIGSINDSYYNYNCMNTAVFKPVAKYSPCPPEIVTNATKDSFTIAACGNIDNDTTVDVWTINDAKQLRNVLDDVKN